MKTRKIISFLALPLLASLAVRTYAADAPKPIAKIGTTVLTEDDMRKEMGMQLYQAENSLYMAQKNWVDQKAQNLIFDMAAKKAGLSRQAWEAKEIDAKVPPADENQV